ncbi:hypothetical protein LSH36_361g05028 [Paralvinella palmiformis]|uniref:Uncharacterized protein n=1 Tax=Paralvinella palmiformis TaxID=53620 RepID=A0AAD9N271_9ANNE|nr:hypothetical protein LSH36_361g05028 [Paralvinella palmiformis]
MADDKLCDI